MYDISRVASKGFMDSLTREEWDGMLDVMNTQRYIDFENPNPLLGQRGAPIGYDETTDPVGREFGEFYSALRGYHPNSITQFTLTSNLSFMNFPLLTHIKKISPRPILLIIGENAHSRYFSEDVYKEANEPKELYIVPGSNHVDLYDRTDKIPFDKLETFFVENMK